MRNPIKPMSNRGRDETAEDMAYAYRRRIGRELARHREASGLTQAEVGTLLDPPMTGAAVSGIELGRVSIAPERYGEFAKLYEIPEESFGRFLLRYSNPWLYALIYGHKAQDLKYDLEVIPERTFRRGKS